MEGGQENGPQKRGEPPQEEVEVETGGGEDGVDAVAVLALEVVAVHAMVGLEVADHRLDGGAAFISRLIAAVVRRTWPLIQTRKRLG